MDEARAGLSVQLEAFAANTMDYLRRSASCCFDGVGVPDIRTDLDGRHVLIVVRGYHYKDDLQTLRHYIREYRPVLIGVDGGADALIEAGHKPDLIVGDMDSVSDDALRCGAEIVVHAYRDGRAPGLERVRAPRRRAGRLPGHRHQRGRRDAARRRQGRRRSSSPSAPTPRWWSSSTRAARAWPARSSPGCGSAASWSTPRGSAGSTGRGSPPSASSLMLVVGLLALGAALWSTDGGRALLQVLGARIDDLWSSIQGAFG